MSLSCERNSGPYGYQFANESAWALIRTFPSMNQPNNPAGAGVFICVVMETFHYVITRDALQLGTRIKDDGSFGGHPL